jgi:outer membrane receptor protein involved in Fe transport
LIIGGRFQDGGIDTQATETRAAGTFPPYPGSSGLGTAFVSGQDITTELTRLSFYGYDQWEVLDAFWLTGGLSYDRLHYPRNSDSPPVSTEQTTTDQISPKAGLIWAAGPSTTLRGAYTKSLGGLFYDASVRLEPSQVAGFNQAYRSLIPESVAGNIPGSRFETADVGLEQRFKTGTYLVLGAEALKSKASRDVGVFDYPSGTPSQLAQDLQFEEYSLSASLNQLLGRGWALGARYKLSDAKLKTQFPEVSDALIPSTDTRALLHSVNLFAIYNHPSGLFAEGQALWAAQSNYGYSPALPGDDFWQFNLFAGYRFPRRQAQITLGLLNLSGQDYRLNPLNLYPELPRSRTLTASLKFNF